MPSSLRRSGAGALLILGFALAGCGSGDAESSDPVAWVGAFCGGIGDALAGAPALREQQPNPQAQKDALLGFIDTAEQAMSDTADKLQQLGPPAIPNGQQVHDTAVNFFSSAADTVAGPRPQLEELDPNAPDFYAKMSQLPSPDLASIAGQVQSLTTNPDLAPSFRQAPECQQLGGAATTPNP